jgi:nucleoside-diphosphate-sugar epimerase
VGEIYNLGHPEVVSLLEFTTALVGICPASRYRLVPFPEDARIIDIGDYYGSFAKLRTAIGWEPRTNLAEGLAQTVAYYRENLAPYLE